MNHSNRPVFGLRKIAIIALVLLIAGYKWYSGTPTNDSPKPDSPFLVSVGDSFHSPAGLIYGLDSTGAPRTKHVLRHAHDIPHREGPHGVFDANGDHVFRVIDEAYEQVKRQSNDVTSKTNDGKSEYVIDMQRRIGFKGGQVGAKQGHPPLNKIKLIVAGKNVITAFPY